MGTDVAGMNGSCFANSLIVGKRAVVAFHQESGSVSADGDLSAKC